MDNFVREQFPAGCRTGGIVTGAKEDVLATGKRSRLQLLGGLTSFSIGVDANITQIVSKRRLQRTASSGGKRSPIPSAAERSLRRRAWLWNCILRLSLHQTAQRIVAGGTLQGQPPAAVFIDALRRLQACRMAARLARYAVWRKRSFRLYLRF